MLKLTNIGKYNTDYLSACVLGMPVSSEVINANDTSDASAVLLKGRCYRIKVSEKCHIKFGEDPEATTSDPLFSADEVDHRIITRDNIKVAAIRATSVNGYVHITLLDGFGDG